MDSVTDLARLSRAALDSPAAFLDSLRNSESSMSWVAVMPIFSPAFSARAEGFSGHDAMPPAWPGLLGCGDALRRERGRDQERQTSRRVREHGHQIARFSHFAGTHRFVGADFLAMMDAGYKLLCGD
jgi:hypothetical protein